MQKSMQKMSMSLAALFISAATLPALAQDNTVYIEQRGSENTLRIDQSGAKKSTVQGVTVDDETLRTVSQTLSRPVAVVDEKGQPVLDDLGIRRTTQEHYTVSASGYLLSGSRTSTALQSGSGNIADITMTGSGGIAGLLQDGDKNTATVNLLFGGSGNVGQVGNGNTATLFSYGEGNILQRGDGNTGELTVGSGATGTLSQNGDRNTTAYVVTSGNVDFIQQGSGLTYTAGGVVVESNAANVTIIQSQMGGY